MVPTLLPRLINAFEHPWKTGDMINGFQINHLVGKGSYGTTYSVKLENGEEAILKRIRPYKKLFSNHVQYVQNEVKVLQTLSHPRFPAFLTVGEYKGIPYWVMEKMNGQTFEKLIFQEGKKYSEEETLKIGLELVRLVDWIHQKGYVHRDLRIPNILYDQNALQIIDFGLACEMESGSDILETHRDYMRVRSKNGDFYAIGHFLLFLLYSSYEPLEKREKSWEEELSIHHETRLILRRLLQIDPVFQDGEELIGALLKALHTK